MLVLARRMNQQIRATLDEAALITLLRAIQQDPERKPIEITTTVIKISGPVVRLGIEAPREVHIVRAELNPENITEPQPHHET